LIHTDSVLLFAIIIASVSLVVDLYIDRPQRIRSFLVLSFH